MALTPAATYRPVEAKMPAQAPAQPQPLAAAHPGRSAQPEAPRAPPHRIAAYVPLLDRVVGVYRLNHASWGAAAVTGIVGTWIVKAMGGPSYQPAVWANESLVAVCAAAAYLIPECAVRWMDYRAVRAERRVGLWTLQPPAQMDRILASAIDASPLTRRGFGACARKLAKVFETYPELDATELTGRLAALSATAATPGLTHDEAGREARARLRKLVAPLVRLCQSGRITAEAMDDGLILLARHIGGDTRLSPDLASALRDVLDRALQDSVTATQPARHAARRAAFHDRLDAVRDFWQPAAAAAPLAQEAREREEDHDAIVIHMPAIGRAIPHPGRAEGLHG